MRSKISFFIIIVVLFSFVLSDSLPTLSVSNHTSLTNTDVFVSEVASLNPGSLDPATATNTQALGFIQLMYDDLFQYTNDSVTLLLPYLATNYTLSSNGLIYTFTIKQGVQFNLQQGETVGQTLNAYVLQYSIDRAIIINAHDGPARTIDQWIKGAQIVENTQDLNVTQAISFLNQQSIKALNKNTLQITLSKPFNGFLQTLMQPVADAVSPKAIIDNEPSSYTTNQDNTYGMVSLTSFFPGIANTTILQNLGLPNSYNIDNSGVVPQSGPNTPTAFTWLADHSAGTGPYHLVDLIQGKITDFSKNNNWWNKYYFQNASPNKIQVIQVANTATRINDLKQGVIEEGNIPLSSLSEFGVTANHTASNYTGVNSYIYNNLTNVFIGMNTKSLLPNNQILEDSTISNYNYGTHNVSRLLKYTWNNSNGNPQMANPTNPFSALLFREAFAYAYPTTTFIDQTLLGFGFPMQGVIPEGVLGHDNNLITNRYIPAYNSSKAQALFNEVGWKGTIVMYYDSNSNLGKISANLLAQSINSLHVNINVQPTVIENVNWNPISGQYALFQSSYTSPYSNPSAYVNNFYGNGTFATAVNYHNPNVNDLINKGESKFGLYNVSNIYNQIETNATIDYPYIYIAQEKNVLLLKTWVQGVDNPASDSLNPMIYFLPLQYLAEGTPGCYGGPCLPGSPSNIIFPSNLTLGELFLMIIFITGVPLILGFIVAINNKRGYSKKRIVKQKQLTKLTGGLFCPNCQELIKPKDVFCPECGMRL